MAKVGSNWAGYLIYGCQSGWFNNFRHGYITIPVAAVIVRQPALLLLRIIAGMPLIKTNAAKCYEMIF